ncbi:MAG: hypothetical protein D6806_13850 [Deltaproteobacteria bacterium]|nr:MAG: hypothetical protein D6806_13850 [Deltaproteobacteria bacterium]
MSAAAVAVCLQALVFAVQAGGSISVVAVGDVNLGSDYPDDTTLPPDEGKSLLRRVRHLLEGDVVFANLEGPILSGGESDKCSGSRNCYAFRTPPVLANRLVEAGFNVVGIANNHAMDFGREGRAKTVEVLDRLGIAHSGPPGDVALLRVRGRSLALVAFTTADHSYNLLDIETAARVVKGLKEKNDLVVVSFHGGTEGSKAQHVPFGMERLGNEPRGELRRFAHAVIDAGADLVIGHGPHVLRGMEVYRRRLIAYSLGNFCTWGRFNLRGPLGVGAILEANLDASTGRFLSGRIIPTFQDESGVGPDPRRRAISIVERLSREDFWPLGPAVSPAGRLSPPPGDTAGLLGVTEQPVYKDVRRLMKRLRKRGFRAAELVEWFGDERSGLVPGVVEKFERPAEKLSYRKYRELFIRPEVLDRAAEFFERHGRLILDVAGRYGIEPEHLAAIVAVESRFGEHTGRYRAFNVLSTVVLKYPRRARWAEKELAALLLMYRKSDPVEVRGSYAGAVGFVQFMPTSVLAYGVDYDGNGRVELDSWPDALASAANYLAKHGYRPGRYERGSAAYRSVYSYNPSHNYARVVGELAALLKPRLKDAGGQGGATGEGSAQASGGR